MKKLIDSFKNPSGFDSISNYSGDIPDDSLLVVMTRTRDSDILTESNWTCALKMLGGESETVEIVRFGHWAVGWIEYLCVKSQSVSEAIGQQIEDKIESYPVLNEGHFSELETEEANRVWSECYDSKDRIEYIREHRSQFEFHNFADMLSCVRGNYFAGYASELI